MLYKIIVCNHHNWLGDYGAQATAGQHIAVWAQLLIRCCVDLSGDVVALGITFGAYLRGGMFYSETLVLRGLVSFRSLWTTGFVARGTQQVTSSYIQLLLSSGELDLSAAFACTWVKTPKNRYPLLRLLFCGAQSRVL